MGRPRKEINVSGGDAYRVHVDVEKARGERLDVPNRRLLLRRSEQCDIQEARDRPQRAGKYQTNEPSGLLTGSEVRTLGAAIISSGKVDLDARVGLRRDLFTVE